MLRAGGRRKKHICCFRYFSMVLRQLVRVVVEANVRALPLGHPTELQGARGGGLGGDTVVVESWEIDRFSTRAGERAVVDMRVTVDDRLVCAVEHEAIVRLAR